MYGERGVVGDGLPPIRRVFGGSRCRVTMRGGGRRQVVSPVEDDGSRGFVVRTIVLCGQFYPWRQSVLPFNDVVTL